MLLFHRCRSSYLPPRATVRGGFLYALQKNVKKIKKNVKKVLTNGKRRAIMKSQRGQKGRKKMKSTIEHGDHKIEITETQDGRAEVKFYEIAGKTWIYLGTETWANVKEALEEYAA